MNGWRRFARWSGRGAAASRRTARALRAIAATLLLLCVAVGVPAAPAVAATPRFLTLPIASTHGMNIQQAWLWSGGSRDGTAGHDGIDYIDAKVDSAPVTWKSFQVVAAAPGRACASRNGQSACGFASAGNWVVMRHSVDGRTWYTFYGHLRTIDPAIPIGRWSDARLARGHSLGMSGHSGDPCCITHLHFELLTGPGHRVDPYGLYARRERYPDPAGKNGRRSASANAWTTNPPTLARQLPTAVPTRSASPTPAASPMPLPGGSQAPSPVASGPPLPAASLDPVLGAFPVPNGSVLINASAASAAPDAARVAAWHSPLDPTGTIAYFTGLTAGRWLPTASPTSTPLGVDLPLRDGDGSYDHAAVSVMTDGAGALISIQLIPAGELLPPGVSPVSTLAPVSLPAWAIPDGATVLASTTIGRTVYAELSVATGPAALMDTYGRALDDAGIAHVVGPDSGSFVVTFTYVAHPGTIVLTPDPAGSHVALALTP